MGSEDLLYGFEPMYNPFDRLPDEEVPRTAPAAIAGPDRSDRRLEEVRDAPLPLPESQVFSADHMVLHPCLQIWLIAGEASNSFSYISLCSHVRRAFLT